MTERIGALPDLQTIARLLGGVVNDGQVLAPGPGHSRLDKSLSIKISTSVPDGFLVNSFAGDDPIVCRDYVREKLGLPAFKPNGRQQVSNDVISQAVMAAALGQGATVNRGAALSPPTTTPMLTVHCSTRYFATNRKTFANVGRTATARGFGN